MLGWARSGCACGLECHFYIWRKKRHALTSKWQEERENSVKTRWIRRIGWLAAAGTLSAIAFAALSWLFIGWTDEGSDRYPGGTVVRDDAGNVLRVSLGPGDTDCRPYYAASADDWIVKAVVASEDGSYWTHHGVRPLSILRAACQNVFYRRRISGASTITMQAVRLIRPHPKTLWWKWKEAVKALKMEREKSKEWILSQYLNRAPYGSNLVGIEAAAQGWFGKGAKELGLGEAAMLAGMVQAPSRFRPDRGYEKAIRRRDYVLGRMLELGMVDEMQVAGAKSVRPAVKRAPRPFACPHFCDWVVERGRGDVTTALNADVQAACERAVNGAAETGGYSSAAVVMRVRDGAVVAMAVSGDYFDPEGGQVNTALTPRPAGSTLKPFLTALALERGVVGPSDRLMDAPVSFKGYRPANFDGKYRGEVTVREALVESLNVPFVLLLKELGVEAFGETLRTLGFANLGASDEDAGLGMAIGNVEVSLLELVSAYAALARGGTLAGGERVFSEETCLQVADMLSGAERSAAALGHVADVVVPRFAWKTGTSSAYRDAWTVAWNPEYAVGVWCGHKSGGFGDRTLVGAKAAAPVAWGIARQLYPKGDGPWFAKAGERKPGGVRPAVGRLGGLAILRPEDGATFRIVAGAMRQGVVCRVAGNADGRRLWWFADGKPVGESVGGAPFAVELDEGGHEITCSTAEGASATVRVKIVRE